MLQSTSTASLCFGLWSVPQEAESEQLLAEGAAFSCALSSMEPVSSPGPVLHSCFAWLQEIPSQGSLSWVSFLRRGGSILGLTLP